MGFRVVYLDTSVIADWLLLKSVDQKIRDKLYKNTKNPVLSTILIDHLLKSKNIVVYVSWWTLSEAENVLKNSTVALKLVYDNVSLRYFNKLKNKEPYKIIKSDKIAIKEAINLFKKEIGKNDNFHLKPIKAYFKNMDDLILNFGLEPPDALHLSIAIKLKCDSLVSRDPDFNKDFSKYKIQTYNPSDAIIEVLKSEKKTKKPKKKKIKK